MATGVLPLVTGNLTRLAQFYTASEKTYEGTVRFGFATDTYDSDGEPIGGLSMARSTVELTFPIIEKARGAIFYDTGFVNSSDWAFGFENIASDIGVGLRLDLPIGPLRLDYGYPLQRNGYHGGGHFNFNVGYQF